MKNILQPIALVLALGLGTSSAALGGDNAAAPEDKAMQHLRDDGYYGDRVYYEPVRRPYRYHYGYNDRYYDRYPYDGRYQNRYQRRPFIGLHVPFVGLHVG